MSLESSILYNDYVPSPVDFARQPHAFVDRHIVILNVKIFQSVHPSLQRSALSSNFLNNSKLAFFCTKSEISLGIDGGLANLSLELSRKTRCASVKSGDAPSSPNSFEKMLAPFSAKQVSYLKSTRSLPIRFFCLCMISKKLFQVSIAFWYPFSSGHLSCVLSARACQDFATSSGPRKITTIRHPGKWPVKNGIFLYNMGTLSPTMTASEYFSAARAYKSPYNPPSKETFVSSGKYWKNRSAEKRCSGSPNSFERDHSVLYRSTPITIFGCRFIISVSAVVPDRGTPQTKTLSVVAVTRIPFEMKFFIIESQRNSTLSIQLFTSSSITEQRASPQSPPRDPSSVMLGFSGNTNRHFKSII